MSPKALIAGILAFVVLAYAAAIVAGLRRRNVDIWWRGYLRQRATRPGKPAAGPTHVMFCFVDHFEPRWGGADPESETERVARWVDAYPRLCAAHRDADGHRPRHTFFFPSEEYRSDHIDSLVALGRQGLGEVEVHLHHDRDTSEGLRSNLEEFLGRLTRHGAIPVDPGTGHPMWAFVHGNWALDNSRPDGRWCGVNDELTILADLGCYADFTLPSAPDRTQTSTVNSIYYATDDPAHPKSHDTGRPVVVGGSKSGQLMIIQGPLGLRWKLRSGLPVPSIENGDVRASNPPTPQRIDFWVKTGVHVAGRPDWIFVKVHTHGTQEQDMPALLGEPVSAMFSHLERRYNDGTRYRLHYVTAREMYNIVRAAESGLTGDPGIYRDLVVPPPSFRPLPPTQAGGDR
jgi:hypothetical protein